MTWAEAMFNSVAILAVFGFFAWFAWLIKRSN
jgi:hypothetical protein